jgi:hypothetical protein
MRTVLIYSYSINLSLHIYKISTGIQSMKTLKITAKLSNLQPSILLGSLVRDILKRAHFLVQFISSYLYRGIECFTEKDIKPYS